MHVVWPLLQSEHAHSAHVPTPAQSWLLPLDGVRRYVWHNGNQYDGEWRAGKMHGQGTLKWVTGERRLAWWGFMAAL